MSSSSMCWTMCMTIIWSPSESSGETSATRIVRIPPANRSRRQRLGGWRSARRARRQPSAYSTTSTTTESSAVQSNVQDVCGLTKRDYERSAERRCPIDKRPLED